MTQREPVYTSDAAVRQSWGFYEWMDYRDDGSFIRLMDYVPDASGKLGYSWVADPAWYRRHTDGDRPDPGRPKTFYHPESADTMRAHPSDFMFLDWKPDPRNPTHPRVFMTPVGAHLDVPPLYEVVNCPRSRSGVNVERNLRQQLIAGIPYQGRIADHVLLPFAGEGQDVKAAVLSRRDVDIRDNLLKLSDDAPNAVPCVTVDAGDVRQIPRQPTARIDRFVYEKAVLPATDRKVAIRPFSHYAIAYLDWFVETQNLKCTGQAWEEAVAILELLVESPESLDQYLGAAPAPDTMEDLGKALRQASRPQRDTVSGFVYELFKRDPGLREQFQAKAAEEYQATIKAREDADRLRLKELEAFEEQRQAKQAELDGLVQEERRLKENVERQETLLEAGRQKLTHIEQEQENAIHQHEATLRKLEEDAALKLGFKLAADSIHAAVVADNATVAAPVPASVPALDAISFTPMHAPRQTQEVDALCDAVAHNLKSLGIRSASQAGDADICKTLAFNLFHTLGSTSLLCVDSAFVPPIANAIAFAIDGIPAQHAGLPVDWSDVGNMESLLEDGNAPVIVLDNVFDTLNETVLFALGRRNARMPIVIIPVGSHANIRLAAPEIWHRAFLVPTGQLLQIPCGSNTLHRARRHKMPAPPPDTVIMPWIGKLKAATHLQPDELLLPASILAAGKEDTSMTMRWALPHLAVLTALRRGHDAAMALPQELKAPAMEQPLRALLERINHGRHAA